MSTKPQPGAGKPAKAPQPKGPDPKTANEIVALTQNNIPLPLICRALQITEQQVEQWLESAQQAKPGSDLAIFARDYHKAQALGEIDLLTKLKAHAATDPNAAFKLLELQAKQKETQADSIPLENSLHEAFCQLVAAGTKPGTAYQQITSTTPKSAWSLACRLSRNVNVKARIEALKRRSATRRCLTRERRLEVCHEVVESSTATHTDRLRAAKLDAELKGELIGKQDLTTNGEALPAVLPPIIINLPERFTRQRGTGKPA